MNIITFPFFLVVLIVFAEYVLMTFVPQWASKLIMIIVVLLSVALNILMLPQLRWSAGFASKLGEIMWAMSFVYRQ